MRIARVTALPGPGALASVTNPVSRVAPVTGNRRGGPVPTVIGPDGIDFGKGYQQPMKVPLSPATEGCLAQPGPRGAGAGLASLCLGLCMACLLSGQATAQEPARVATVLGVSITRGELDAVADDRSRARKLLAMIWDRIAPHYIASRGLQATPVEIAEVAAYDEEFDSRDRSQRARKLAELDQRLAGDDLSAAERARLQDFRATLGRLARYDAERAREPLPDPAQQAVFYAPWVELWKMNKALYEEYGGVVALTRFGHDPQGARAALLKDYERRGLLRITDPLLRDQVIAVLDARPSMVVAPEDVDFTPYWKRPIPASYFPD